MTPLIVLSILAVAAIVAAAWVLFVEYPQTAVDATRNELFSLRDELFEVARSGVVAFDNPGYCASRDMLNGMIRYAHDVSALHLIASKLFANSSVRALRRAADKVWQQEFATLPKSAREPVGDIMNRASVAMVRLVVFRSVGLSCAFAVYALCHAVATLFFVIKQAFAEVSVRRKPNAATCEADPAEVSHARNNVEASMDDAITHFPMKAMPKIIRSEARRYAPRESFEPMLSAA